MTDWDNIDLRKMTYKWIYHEADKEYLLPYQYKEMIHELCRRIEAYKKQHKECHTKFPRHYVGKDSNNH